jgi:hypothetical protein
MYDKLRKELGNPPIIKLASKEKAGVAKREKTP